MAPPLAEPSRASDYDDRGVQAAHSVLVELGQILGPYRESVVIVGGMVPYLLYPQVIPGHIGTLDIDLNLDPDNLDDGQYAQLIEILEGHGYERNVDPLKPFQLRRTVDLRDGGGPVPVLVDLLMPRTARPSANRPPLVMGLRVQGVDGGEIALTNPVRLPIDGAMPDGRQNSVSLLVASIPALLVMKGYALDGRDKQKDAYDIYFSVRNYAGGPVALANECAPLLHEPIARKGFMKISAKFRSDRDYGPQSVVQFFGGGADFDGMSAEQLGVDAFRQVRAWLDALGLERSAD